jgi:predicted GIY-YIG superfamily endonuclease
MYYVYRIQSLENKNKSFIGTTRNVKKRLAMHNRRKISSTAMDAPWRVSFYAAFTRKERAEEFKEFLKTREGKSFAHKHFWSVGSTGSSHHGDA